MPPNKISITDKLLCDFIFGIFKLPSLRDISTYLCLFTPNRLQFTIVISLTVNVHRCTASTHGFVEQIDGILPHYCANCHDFSIDNQFTYNLIMEIVLVDIKITIEAILLMINFT